MWLDGIEQKYIEEVGAMNIFFVINGELITPMLTGSILPGITRDSVIALAKQWGIKVSERKISIDEVLDAHATGKLEEIFGSGTAAVISPVGEIKYGDTVITVITAKSVPWPTSSIKVYRYSLRNQRSANGLNRLSQLHKNFSK